MTPKQSRRRFLTTVGGGVGTLALAAPAVAETITAEKAKPQEDAGITAPTQADSAIDFRYAPLSWQTAICFPDDPHKTLVGERGELLYGYDGPKGIHYFAVRAEFSVHGMEQDRLVSQRIESPHVPILHTILERPGMQIELTTFASNAPDEGRVDNVIMQIRPTEGAQVRVAAKLKVVTSRELKLERQQATACAHWDNDNGPLLFSANRQTKGFAPYNPDGISRLGPETVFDFKAVVATREKPGRIFFRFPQSGQAFGTIAQKLNEPDAVLEETRQFWKSWKPLGGATVFELPESSGAFLAACARNILQAREVRDGKLTFQVGAAQYRGLWIVDGNFILEAARYLGHDKEAQQGLETTWAKQRSDGGVFAGGGDQHWKDTAIAMHTMVRQAELSQSWEYFDKSKPQLLHAADFLIGLRDAARKESNANGRYGLLAQGLGDGGLIGQRSEFTNTVWAIAGLKATIEAADARGCATDFARVRKFHDELHAAFLSAAGQEMRRHPDGFEYLPMLMKEDKEWGAEDEWDRPRPQNAQWALSHAIYPGGLLAPDHAIVQGHIRLMQSCTQEDIPAETGWAINGGVWNYNASFVAHVYLWAGLSDWARRTFTGFLNHAAPTYVWREEQPLRTATLANYVGDMPHNWASAECVRYLRHILALEDGKSLRLLEGIGAPELAARQAYRLTESPTRFGRVNLTLEPNGSGWSLRYERPDGPNPTEVRLPQQLGKGLTLKSVQSAATKSEQSRILVDPAARQWTAQWSA